MLANLHRSGTWPVFREWRQMVYNGRARECRHIIMSLAGKSSGPAAELGLSSSMASMRSDSENNIQIKICAEYRDMLPRPRLVCQEPGLRPIGRSPGVPDKSIL